MNNPDSILRESERLSRRWDNPWDRPFRVQASMLTEVRTFKSRVAEAALGLKRGKDRRFLLRVRNEAGAFENALRANLVAAHYPALGDCA